jgi:hypothetical protein
MPKCLYCRKAEASWVYMPSGEYACDDCVPRKCSCNMEPIDGNWENENESNWDYIKDEKGKHLPCCEWEQIKKFL